MIVNDASGADVPLARGFNLIGIPVRFAATTTFEDVTREIAEQKGQASSVLAWDEQSQMFVTWVAVNPEPNNLEVEEGRGYFVRVTRPTPRGAWRATGAPITVGVPLDLAPGFNLVSVPFSAQPYDSSGLAQAIGDVGGNVSSILAWNAASQTFETWVAANPGANPFEISPSAGYFVRITQAPSSPFVP